MTGWEIADIIGRVLVCLTIVSGMLIFLTCNLNFLKKKDSDSKLKDN